MLLNGAFDLVAMDLNLAELGDGMAWGLIASRRRRTTDSLMTTSFMWNVRGLNDHTCHNVVWEFMLSHRPTLVYLQETKLSVICNPLANEMLGASFDYDYLPSLGAVQLGGFYWLGRGNTGLCPMLPGAVSLCQPSWPRWRRRETLGGLPWYMVRSLMWTR